MWCKFRETQTYERSDCLAAKLPSVMWNFSGFALMRLDDCFYWLLEYNVKRSCICVLWRCKVWNSNYGYLFEFVLLYSWYSNVLSKLWLFPFFCGSIVIFFFISQKCICEPGSEYYFRSCNILNWSRNWEVCRIWLLL